MNILILGHGGREHALVDLIHQSKKVNKLYVLNGNPGMLKYAIPLFGEESLEYIQELCKIYEIDWVIPGGETYLSEGITDVLTSHGIQVFGPTKSASLIESSKAYAKMIMQKYQVPTAAYQLFDCYEQAIDYCKTFEPPYVIKYDGLAFGKGVTIAKSFDEAREVLHDLMIKRIYGNAKVLIEEFLKGEEYSMICMVHHHTVLPLPLAKDHKSRYEKNQGPNTGGMGAYSPVDFVSDDVYQKSLNIMQSVASGMVNENNPFTGFLYGGFILTSDGPKIIEFNCRLGDPEAEVILPKIQSDFMEVIENVSKDQYVDLQIDNKYHLGVVLVSDGYPGHYEKKIAFDINKKDEEYIYHMGTMIEQGQIFTNGGRVLFVRGEGDTLESARKCAYERVQHFDYPHLKYRKDIGKPW